MTIRELTLTEQATVQNKRKTDNELPRYYNPDIGLDVKISREFEIWLILTPMGTRSNIANWLSQLAQNTPHDSAFDDLATEFMEDETANAETENNEYDSVLADYDRFRSSLNTDGFTGVAELGTLLSQTVEGLGRVGAARSSAIFTYALATMNQSDLATRRVDENVRRSLRSWVTVLLTYT